LISFSNTLRDALPLFLSMTTADLLSACKTAPRGYGRSISLPLVKTSTGIHVEHHE
jgi:hypothetical protein